MSIQVLSLAAALHDNHKKFDLTDTMSPSSPNVRAVSPSVLSLSSSSRETLPGVVRVPGGSSGSASSLNNSPLLSAAIAAKSVQGLSQLRALNSTNADVAAAMNGSIGMTSNSNKRSNEASEGTTPSGIVSHLRASSLQAQRQQQQEIDALLGTLQAYRNHSASAATSHSLLASLLTPMGATGRSLLSTPSPSTALAVMEMDRILSNRALAEAQLLQRLQATTPSTAAIIQKLLVGGSGQFPVNVGASASVAVPSTNPATNGVKNAPIALYMDCDEDSLSEYQCLIRKQMELFEASAKDAASSVQGRNKAILPGQVGIRCRHCAMGMRAARRGSSASTSSSGSNHSTTCKGSMYFPTKLDRIYQAAQNLASYHLCETCPNVPENVRNKILVLRERKSPAGGGKRYWAEGVRCLGVVEDPQHGGLRFSNNPSTASKSS